MSDTPTIQGAPDPRKSSELQGDNPVDPEKFRRSLKVDESDETEKREQRRKPKKQEEEDEIDETIQDENLPSDEAFAAHMKKSEKKDSILAPKKGTQETITPSKEPVSPLNLLTPTKSEEAKSSLKMAAPETPLKEPPTTKRESLSETEEVKKTEETQIPQAEFIDTSFVAPPPEQKSIETPSTVEEEKTIEEPSATASLLKEGEKEKEKEEEAEEVFVPPDTTHAIVEGPPLLQTDTPSYAHLNPEVFELFERMIGYMVIEETKGIAITTVKLSMPGSVFNDCEIKLEHYDTAPSSFNIQLSGNPEAVDLFNASFSDLAAAFAQSNYAFDVHLRRPILSTEHRHLIQRKDRVVGDESSKKENAG